MERNLDRVAYFKAREGKTGRWVMVREWIDGLDVDNRKTVNTCFEREVHIGTLLRDVAYGHAPIVELYEPKARAGGTYDRLFLEFVPGLWLSNALAHGPLGERNALVVARDIALAVTAHASHGVVHLNIQPTTVLLRYDPANERLVVGAKLDDYGYAYCPSLPHETVEVRRLAREYCPPDLRAGAPPHTSHDLYNIGLLLWEMVAGKPYARAKAEGSETIRQLSVASVTQQILERALHEDPAQRYREPIDLATALQKALDTVSADPAYRQPSSAGRKDSHPWGGLIGVLVVLIVLCLGLAVWLPRNLMVVVAPDPTPAALPPTLPMPTTLLISMTAASEAGPTMTSNVSPTIRTNGTTLPTTVSTNGPVLAGVGTATLTRTAEPPAAPLEASDQTSTAEVLAATERATALNVTFSQTQAAASTLTAEAFQINLSPTAPPRPSPTATEVPKLRFIKLNENDNPSCISVQIRYVRTNGWYFTIVNTPLRGEFDEGGNARVCGLPPRQEVHLNVLNSRSQIIRGGQGIPSRGGAIMRADWR